MTRKSANGLNKAVILWLNTRGHRVWRNNTTGVYDPARRVFRKSASTLKGVGDIIGLSKSGRHIEIETKQGDDKMSLHQLIHADTIRSRNGIYILARGIDQFIKEAEAIGL